MSDTTFDYDVFLSHSSKDNAVVHPLAERLRADGLRVWLDDWEIKPGDYIHAKIEEGLERSRVLVLCMSANAFGSDWAQLESGTFRFRDPLNRDRRFVPLRLDDARVTGSLEQFLHIDWRLGHRRNQYQKLLAACRQPETSAIEVVQKRDMQAATRSIQFSGHIGTLLEYRFAANFKSVMACSLDHAVRLWDIETGDCLHILVGHTKSVWSVAWSTNQRLAISGSSDNTLRVWDVNTGRCLRVLEGHTNAVRKVALNEDQRKVISASADNTVRLWDIDTGRCLRVLSGHTSSVWSVTWSTDHQRVLSGSSDNTLRLWDVETGQCLRVMEGHTDCVMSLAWSHDMGIAASGSRDCSIRLWDMHTGHCVGVLLGHTGTVWSVALSSDRRLLLSGANDNTVRLWDPKTARCLRVLGGHKASIVGITWSEKNRLAVTGDHQGRVNMWDMSEFMTAAQIPDTGAPSLSTWPDHVDYTNAKVLLVGESGAGKTGLSKRLALNSWEPSDSTVGAWATQWKLPVESAGGVEREIWLWDFGGQSDQRLIHQLYMEDTALAVLVFDGQKEDLFETLGQWDRDLTRASSKPFAKLLVAGRVDTGGLRVSRNQLENFASERGFTVRLFETSAKVGTGCDALKRAILDGIRWENIPWRSTPLLFKRLKEEIIRLKDADRVLMRFNELRETLQLRLSGEFPRFSDEELKAVVGLLCGPGVLWELTFGSWILLQPERINAYAQAVIQTMREDQHERGCLPEDRVLSGELTYHSSMSRLDSYEERFVLLAMHQTLLERGLCLREHTEQGPLLVFPSFYRRERPELVGHPAVLVSYRFTGFLDDIYSTLVVRLHHTGTFQQDELWRYAADFRTHSEKQLGIKLTRRSEGSGELDVYFDTAIPVEEKIIFSKYVHEHLLRSARDVIRLRYYVCPHCGTPVGNRDVATQRLADWIAVNPINRAAPTTILQMQGRGGPPTIVCAKCERRVPLWDQLEAHFASSETKEQVRELERQSQAVLDNESKERVLVGEVISTVALAGQICREFNVSDHGLDMEIEFKSDEGEATARKVYLQLKSGNSYLKRRQRDGAEIFHIPDERHARYWREQVFPVVLVIRNSEGAIRWMEVRNYLERESEGGKKPVRQIVFQGQRFDVMSVRRWREQALGTL